jgi:hypothetical protein
MGQRKHLEHVTIEGDQAFLDQGVPGKQVLINTKTQKTAHFVVAVKAKPFAVTGQHQKQVKYKLMMGKALKKAIPEETMLQKSKAALNLTDPIWTKRSSLNHKKFLYLF